MVDQNDGLVEGVDPGRKMIHVELRDLADFGGRHVSASRCDFDHSRFQFGQTALHLLDVKHELGALVLRSSLRSSMFGLQPVRVVDPVQIMKQRGCANYDGANISTILTIRPPMSREFIMDFSCNCAMADAERHRYGTRRHGGAVNGKLEMPIKVSEIVVSSRILRARSALRLSFGRAIIGHDLQSQSLLLA